MDSSSNFKHPSSKSLFLVINMTILIIIALLSSSCSTSRIENNMLVMKRELEEEMSKQISNLKNQGNFQVNNPTIYNYLSHKILVPPSGPSTGHNSYDTLKIKRELEEEMSKQISKLKSQGNFQVSVPTTYNYFAHRTPVPPSGLSTGHNSYNILKAKRELEEEMSKQIFNLKSQENFQVNDPTMYSYLSHRTPVPPSSPSTGHNSYNTLKAKRELEEEMSKQISQLKSQGNFQVSGPTIYNYFAHRTPVPPSGPSTGHNSSPRS